MNINDRAIYTANIFNDPNTLYSVNIVDNFSKVYQLSCQEPTPGRDYFPHLWPSNNNCLKKIERGRKTNTDVSVVHCFNLIKTCPQ